MDTQSFAQKKLFRLSLFLLIGAALTFNSCKKNSSTTADDSVSAQDQSQVSSALNTSVDDAANAAGGVQAISGKTDAVVSICGATIDSSQKANGIITLNYANTPGCFSGTTRTGSITITLQGYANGTRWKDQGAVLQLDFNNLMVTNTATGGSVTLSGTHYLTNVSGGLAWRILDGLDQGTVIHKHTASNFTITFDDGTQRTWSVNRIRTYSNTGGVKTITLSADTTVDGIGNVDAWGTNRNGVDFYSAITTPIVSSNVCGWYKPYAGEFTHHIANRSIDILYGVDISGNAVSSGCAYGYKITYTKNNQSRTRIVSYWF